MERDEIIWVLECCLLRLDGLKKEQMLLLGCPEKLVEIGIKLSEYLNNKPFLTI